MSPTAIKLFLVSIVVAVNGMGVAATMVPNLAVSPCEGLVSGNEKSRATLELNAAATEFEAVLGRQNFERWQAGEVDRAIGKFHYVLRRVVRDRNARIEMERVLEETLLKDWHERGPDGWGGNSWSLIKAQSVTMELFFSAIRTKLKPNLSNYNHQTVGQTSGNLANAALGFKGVLESGGGNARRFATFRDSTIKLLYFRVLAEQHLGEPVRDTVTLPF